MRVIDKLIEQWHKDEWTTTSLHEYMGLTLEQYARFVEKNEVADPRLAAEYTEPKIHPRFGGAKPPPGHPVGPGWIVPAKRELKGP